MSETDRFTGCLLTDEDRRWLLNNGRVYGEPRQSLAFPAEFDPRPILRVEDQGQRNSCVGHGVTSCGEACAWIDSGGKLSLQFSRWGSYIWAQQASGHAGSDEGAGVGGAVRASTEIGFCPESIWPYPVANARYSTKEPAGARAAAEPYRLMGHAVIDGYARGFGWINQGKGPLLIGVSWTAGLRDNRGPITLADARGSSRFGHCMFVWGWDREGLLYVGNSHTKAWGDQGWRKVRPEVIDYWAQRGEVYGMSDLRDVRDSRPMIVDAGEGM